MSAFRTILVLTAVTIAAGACTRDAVTVPQSDAPALAAVKFWDVNATSNWNERADVLAARRPVGLNGGRMFTYLAMAQYRAGEAAELARGAHPPVSAAIGAASAAILNAFFPLDIAENEAVLDAQENAEPWPGAKHQDFAVGEAIGRAIAARVMSFAASDLSNATNPGAPPIGPGFWRTPGPLARGNLGARPFLLTSGSEIRPDAPPAFGSPAYLAALAEVRQISDTRTPAQVAIAQYWHVNQSPASNAAQNGIARALIRSHRVKDVEAARILFQMQIATWDALVACFDAKYHYWLVRPVQADPLITIAAGVTLPPHPSFPSAHSCVSGAWSTVLEQAFPDATDELEAAATEAGISRLYAGLHYRFDMEAGRTIGRTTGARTLAANLATVGVLP